MSTEQTKQQMIESIKSTYIFSENFYEPFENPYKVGDMVNVFLKNGTSTNAKVVATTIIEQYRQYKLEFYDGSTAWFDVNYIKSSQCN